MKNLVPKSIIRFTARQTHRLNQSSPTVLVVAGVVGFGATAVMAARATRRIDPVLDEHAKARVDLDSRVYETKQARSGDLLRLYSHTSLELVRIYGPTIVVGTLSTASVLYGHRILQGRHVATLAAYSGLAEQVQAYRGRVAKTLGEDAERDIWEGAHGEWVEDPDNKGQFKLEPKYDEKYNVDSYLTPWFDRTNVHWCPDAQSNYIFLSGVQSHMQTVLNIRGHVFLNEVFDALHMPRTPQGAVAGWVKDNPLGDTFVDFGFMSAKDPARIAFSKYETPDVQLNFNIDRGPIVNLI